MIEWPPDYEACGHCGFDHEYEPQESIQKHYVDALAVVRSFVTSRHQQRSNLIGVDYGDHIMLVKVPDGKLKMLMSEQEWADEVKKLADVGMHPGTALLVKV